MRKAEKEVSAIVLARAYVAVQRRVMATFGHPKRLRRGEYWRLVRDCAKPIIALRAARKARS